MSKSLYTTIIEEIAPTTTTVGVVGQLYLDSTTKILYQCVAINIEDLTYEWKPIGGGDVYLHRYAYGTSIIFDIVSTKNSNMFETVEDLKQFLIDRGYTSATNALPGRYFQTGEVLQLCLEARLYYSNNNIQYAYMRENADNIFYVDGSQLDGYNSKDFGLVGGQIKDMSNFTLKSIHKL